MLKFSKARNYCLGKEFVSLDEMILDQGFLPDAGSRKTASEILNELGWVRFGNKRIEGKVKAVWKRKTSKDSIELEIRKLELLEKRQSTDVYTIEKLIELGFTKDQTMAYLRMLYMCEPEVMASILDEEKEAKAFAERIEEQANTKIAASRMMNYTGYMFYCEKHFPELCTESHYLQCARKANAALMFIDGVSIEELEWNALNFEPHFLDLVTKISDKADYGEYKQWLVEKYLTKKTIDKFLGNELDYKMLAALCLVARRVEKEIPFSNIYGIDKKVSAKMKKHCEKLRLTYGK